MCSRCKECQTGFGLNSIGPVVRNQKIYQRGYGYSTYNVYPRYIYTQEGRGFGSVFLPFFKFFKPMIYKGVKAIGKEFLDASKDIIENKDNKPIKEAIRARGTRAFKNLKEKAKNKAENIMKGAGQKGIKRKHSVDSTHSIAAIRPVNTHKKKKRRVQRKKKLNKKPTKKRVFFKKPKKKSNKKIKKIDIKDIFN